MVCYPDVYVPTRDTNAVVRARGWVHEGSTVYKVVSTLQWCGDSNRRIQYLAVRAAEGHVSLPHTPTTQRPFPTMESLGSLVLLRVSGDITRVVVCHDCVRAGCRFPTDEPVVHNPQQVYFVNTFAQ